MSISVVGTPVYKGQASGVSSATASGTFTAGNTLIVAVSAFENAQSTSYTISSVVDTTNSRTFTHDWATHTVTSGGQFAIGWDVFSLTNITGGSTTLTVSLGDTTTAIDVLVYQLAGIATVSPLDTGVSAHTGYTPASSVVNTAAGAVASANEIVLSFVGSYANNPDMTQSTSGWTTDAHGVGQPGGYGAAHRFPNAAETPTLTWSVVGGASDWLEAAMVAYKGASAGGSSPNPPPIRLIRQAVQRAANW